jgi:hypothetical protein
MRSMVADRCTVAQMSLLSLMTVAPRFFCRSHAALRKILVVPVIVAGAFQAQARIHRHHAHDGMAGPRRSPVFLSLVEI